MEGAQPPPRGLGDVPFRPNPLTPFPAREGGKFGGGEVSLRVGPKTPANPKLTRVGKGESRGQSPPGRGLWGVSPHKFKRGGELPTFANPPRVGPKTPANPKPTGAGKRGWRGRSPLPGGLGDVPFRPNPLTPFPAREGGKFGGGEVSLRVGPKTPANPKPTGAGKRGGQGGKAPLAEGVGDVPQLSHVSKTTVASYPFPTSLISKLW